ncbi:MAG: ATP-dependent Clp protease ATP-binding subunit [Patescibacteria group bacterium]
MTTLQQPISPFSIVTCPQCQGKGCGACDGFGVASVYADFDVERAETKTFIWRRPIDWAHIAERLVETTTNRALNGLLIASGVAGVGLGLWAYSRGWLAGTVWQLTVSPFDFEWRGWRGLAGDWRIILFWVSIFFDGLLYYRFQRAGKHELAVIKVAPVPTDVKNLPPRPPPTWAQVAVDTGAIDISRSYDAEALAAIEQGWRIAKNWHHAEVLPLHLLAGLFGSQRLQLIFSRLGTDFDTLVRGIKAGLATLPPVEFAPELSRAVKEILFQAYALAATSRQPRVTVAELLVAVDERQNVASQLLYDIGLEVAKIKNVVVWLQINEKLRRQWQERHRLGRRRPKGEVNKAYTAVMTPALNQFSTDLTGQAARGLFPPYVGREAEIGEALRIMESNRQSVVLIGPSGVGKSAVIEEIAQRMIADDVPKSLRDARLVALSIPKLTAGADAAQANGRLLASFNDIARAGNVVLVVENIHELVGISAGTVESLDLADTLANYASKTTTMMIATTTPAGLQVLDQSPGLLAALHHIPIEEPDINQAIQMVEAHVAMIENQHQVYFSYDAIATAVQLASRYIHERYLPAKAIEVLQEVAVAVAQQKGKKSLVTTEDVATVVAERTRIPVTKITAAESDKLVNLEQEIHQRMIGQDDAVKEVASALRRARAGVREGTRPIANFLFLGPTGVGKTELAKTIAAVYFGDENAMIRLDMSEYQTKESIYRLIGDPTDRNGGYLTDAVRRQPFALLLFDEVEKAHPDILNLFLQLMDDGRLTDAAGRTVPFQDTIVIMTSNAGTAFIQQQITAGTPLATIRQRLLAEQLGTFFRPEFINRFDGVNVFAPLTMADVMQIAGLMIAKHAKLLAAEGVTLTVTPAAVEGLATAGFDPQFGARPLRRVIQEQLANTIANLKITSQMKRGDVVTFDIGGKVSVHHINQPGV